MAGAAGTDSGGDDRDGQGDDRERNMSDTATLEPTNATDCDELLQQPSPRQQRVFSILEHRVKSTDEPFRTILRDSVRSLRYGLGDSHSDWYTKRGRGNRSTAKGGGVDRMAVRLTHLRLFASSKGRFYRVPIGC